MACFLFILCGKRMAKYDFHIREVLPWDLGNRGKDIYFRGTEDKGQILSGTGDQRYFMN